MNHISTKERLDALLNKYFLADETVRTNIQLSTRRGVNRVDLTNSTLKALRIKRTIERIVSSNPHLATEQAERNKQ